MMWNCSRCTLENENFNDKCVACLKPKTIKLPDINELERLSSEYLLSNPLSPQLNGVDVQCSTPHSSNVTGSLLNHVNHQNNVEGVVSPQGSSHNQSNTIVEEPSENGPLNIIDDHFGMNPGSYYSSKLTFILLAFVCYCQKSYMPIAVWNGPQLLSWARLIKIFYICNIFS